MNDRTPAARDRVGDPFLPVAEELHVGLRDRPAADGVGHEAVDLLVHRLADDGGVGDPDDDIAGVAALHLRADEVRAGALERRGDGDAPVEMALARLQLQLPRRRLLEDVLRLVLADEPRADVGDVHPVPVELLRRVLEIRFDVVEKFPDVDLLRLEVDLFAVAEPELDRRADGAGRLRADRLEHAPVALDLVQALPLPPVRSIAERDAPAPVVRRLLVLPAVLEEVGQPVERLLRQGRLLVGDVLVNQDAVELVGQLEALDAAGEARDGLVLAERVERPRAALVFLLPIGEAAAEEPTVLGQRLRPELRAEEIGEVHLGLAGHLRPDLGGHVQRPAPALAVVLRRLPAFGRVVEDRRAVGIDGRAASAAVAVIIPLLVIRQLVQVAQILSYVLEWLKPERARQTC